MTEENPPPKRGRKPIGLVDLRVSVTPAQERLLTRLSRSTGLSKAALVRAALVHWAVGLGHLPPGSTQRVVPTRQNQPERTPHD